jgi:hypothetical protein
LGKNKPSWNKTKLSGEIVNWLYMESTYKSNRWYNSFLLYLLPNICILFCEIRFISKITMWHPFLCNYLIFMWKLLIYILIVQCN